MGPRAFALRFIRQQLLDITVDGGYSQTVELGNIKESMSSDMSWELEKDPVVMLTPIGADLEAMDEMSVTRTLQVAVAFLLRNATKEAALDFVDDIEQVLVRHESVPADIDNIADFTVLTCQVLEENYEPELFQNDDKVRGVEISVALQFLYDPQVAAFQ